MPRRKQPPVAVDDEAASGNNTAARKRAQQALLEAVDDNQNDDSYRDIREKFTMLFNNNNDDDKALRRGISSKEQRDILLRAIEEFPKPDAMRFFSGLLSATKSTLEDGAHIPETGRDEEVDAENVQADEASSKALLFFRFVSICTQVYFEQLASKRADNKTDRPVETIEELFQIALELHNTLFELQQCGPDGQATQRSILKLCEAWWHGNGQRREYVISQTVPLLVVSAIDDTASNVELTRLYKIRHAVQYIDFEDESSEWLRSNLMRVASSPRCLKFPEGRKFSAYLFQVDPLLVPSVHQAMKAQIPGGSKAVLEAYAEIYYRAWKDVENKSSSEDEDGDSKNEQTIIREHIENQALSDIVYCMIHIAKPSMFRALMKCLQRFHDNNRKPEVEDLLHRLYGPLLWRSLSAANATVRINATYILAEVFPLDQSSHTQTGKQIEKACTCIKELLQDEDSKVREAASFAVAKVLSNSWDALPSSEIRSMLNEVVTRHASDASSPAVRSGALDTVTFLLQTPQSHAVLRPLLPKLGNLIHDRVEKVRLAAVRLLEQVKVTPGIKYFDVVPVSDIRAHLAEERTNGPVVGALAALTINSFVPQGDHVKRADRLRRTLQFLKKDPEAALAFYSNMSRGCSFQVVAELAILLMNCLSNAIVNDDDCEPTIGEDTTTINVGTRIRREFDVGWFDGEVTAVKKRGRFRVLYEDGDEETLGKDIVVEAVADYNRHHNKGKRKRVQAGDENSHPNRADPGNKKDSHSSSDELMTSSQTSLVASVAQTVCALWHSIRKHIQKSSNKKWRHKQIECFSNTVKEIVEFADQTAAGTENHEIHEQCYKIRTAMLRCASWLSPDDTNGLSTYMQSVFQQVHESPAYPAHKSSVPSYVALFFLLGMESEIVASLSSSISGFFKEREASGLFDNPPLDLQDHSSSTCPIPLLPPKIALDATAAILQSSTPIFEDARNKLLQSDDSCEQLKEALGKGLSYFSRLLVNNFFPGKTVTDASVDYGLRCCELYGKLIVHSTTKADNVNAEVEKILQWATSTLVQPFVSIEHANSPEFQDPDLSRISMSTSHSPSPGGTQRCLARPSVPSSSIGSAFRDDIEGSKTVITAAESLFIWVSMVAIECLSLTGVSPAVASTEALHWCQIFQAPTPVSNIILQGFLRLAIVLALGHGRFELLKTLLVEFREKGKDVEEIFDESLDRVVAQLKRMGANHRQEYLECVFESFQSSTSHLTEQPTAELPDSLEKLWPREGSVTASLGSVLRLKEGRMQMIEMAMAAIKKELQNTGSVSETSMLCNLQLAWCFHITSPSQESKDTLNSLNSEAFEGTAVQSTAEKILESL